MKSLEKLARQYITGQKLMQLATSMDDVVWVCSVFYMPDDDLNLYWISLPDTKHSMHIKQNPASAVTIVAAGIPGAPIAGVQMSGDSHIVEDQSIIDGIIVEYSEYFDRGADWLQGYRAGKNSHKLYVFRPKTFQLYDTANFPEHPKQIV